MLPTKQQDWQPGLKYFWETGQVLTAALTSSTHKVPEKQHKDKQNKGKHTIGPAKAG